MDRLFNLNRPGSPCRGSAAIGALALVAMLSACDEDKRQGDVPPSRVNAVRSTSKNKAGSVFCEKTFPASGATSRSWVAPPDRPLPSGVPKLEPQSRSPADLPNGADKRWVWINVWASWCGPCVKEMPLLSRWKRSLLKEGVDVRFELWSVDEQEEALVGAIRADMPGPIRWLRSVDDIHLLMEALQIAEDSALPVHALVDSAGKLRCVRVGAVEGHAYGYVRSILQD